MKNTWIYLVLIACFVTSVMGCNDLTKELEDVYEEAPGFCKAMCRDWLDCEEDHWLEGHTGDYAENAYDDRERMCVLECALPCSEGMYVVEYDQYTYEVEYVDYVSGSTYQSYASCVWTLESEYYECNYHQWQMLDIDEDYCVELDECTQGLGLDWSCNWEVVDGYYGPYEYCYCDQNGQELTMY